MKHLLRHGVVFVFYGLITCLLFFPLLAHLSTHLLDAASGDPLLQVWVTQWTIHKLTTSISHYFNANIFYPYPNTFAFHDHMIGLGLLGLPLQLAGQNPILTFNLLLLLSFAFSAFSIYLLTYELCKHRYAAFFAGTIFGFLPYRMAHLDHLNLLSIYWLPLSILFLTRVILARAASFRSLTRPITLFWLCYLLQALTSFNYLFMTTIVIAIYGLSLLAWEWEFDAVIFQRALRRDLLPFFFGGCLAMVVLLPLTFPYLKANRDMGFERTTEEIAGLSATSPNYLAAPENNLLYGNVTKYFRSTSSPYPKEQMLFPGLIPLLLAALTFPLCWKKRAAADAPPRGVLRSLWLLMGCAFIMSLGPSVVLFGRSVSLPYAYLYDYLPGFKSMRVPARFGLIVAFCIAMLAAFAIVRIEQHVKSRFRRRGFAILCGTGLFIGLLLEYWPSHLALTPYPGTIERIPPVYTWLRQQPDDLRIIELPMNSPKNQFESLYYSTFHWKRMVNGRSAFIPDGISRLFDEMRQFPSPRALAALQSLKVDTVILHTDERQQPFPDVIPNEMALVEQFGQDMVFRIAEVAGAPRWQVAYRLPATLQAHDTYRIGMALMPASAQPMSPLPLEQMNLELTWKMRGQIVRQERHSVSLPFLFEHGKSETLPFRLTTPEALGQYEVSLRLSDQRFEPTTFITPITLVQDAPDSRSPQQLQADVLRVEYQSVWPAGKPFPVKVEARNSGDTLWRARILNRRQPAGEVRLAVRNWHDLASQQSFGQTANINLDARGLLPYDVVPGDTVVVTLNIPTPPIPGRYRVECDFVSEAVRWFDLPFSFEVTLE
ncbi:hypothetical protein U14_00309 [Candidatus Moduliflexus flocculans]|uniref:Uncharacterized protein n=1 Tax=Candidatus Moduliflexus flocculans TaxID=1499966 RepID=A0A0S6VV67_9BACT|nr:hypothetical protein U14_00309 [Candidatus Moduliflexus flocculans]